MASSQAIFRSPPAPASPLPDTVTLESSIADKGTNITSLPPELHLLIIEKLPTNNRSRWDLKHTSRYFSRLLSHLVSPSGFFNTTHLSRSERVKLFDPLFSNGIIKTNLQACHTCKRFRALEHFTAGMACRSIWAYWVVSNPRWIPPWCQDGDSTGREAYDPLPTFCLDCGFPAGRYVTGTLLETGAPLTWFQKTYVYSCSACEKRKSCGPLWDFSCPDCKICGECVETAEAAAELPGVLGFLGCEEEEELGEGLEHFGLCSHRKMLAASKKYRRTLVHEEEQPISL